MLTCGPVQGSPDVAGLEFVHAPGSACRLLSTLFSTPGLRSKAMQAALLLSAALLLVRPLPPLGLLAAGAAAEAQPPGTVSGGAAGRGQRPGRALIVGGAAAESPQWFPSVCSVRSEQGDHLCGATLIGPRLAVSAQACVQQYPHLPAVFLPAESSSMRVEAHWLPSQVTAAYCALPPGGPATPTLHCGLYQQYSQSNGTFEVLRTVHTAVHEQYQPSSFCGDIAVLELERDAVVGRPIAALLQPAPDWPNTSLPAGYPLTVLGWGYTG